MSIYLFLCNNCSSPNCGLKQQQLFCSGTWGLTGLLGSPCPSFFCRCCCSQVGAGAGAVSKTLPPYLGRLRWSGLLSTLSPHMAASVAGLLPGGWKWTSSAPAPTCPPMMTVICLFPCLESTPPPQHYKMLSDVLFLLSVMTDQVLGQKLQVFPS